MIPKVSVIIPIYNVEKYLDRCIDSVRNQTFENIEIICVDDCSPDNSLLIVKEHASKDSRIRVIRHEKNLGLGGARNSGIKASRAEYIASVDSDDYIKSEMIEKLWEATDNGSADIVCCGFDRINEIDEVVFESSFTETSILNNDNNIDIFNLFNPNFWNKLWKKSLFTKNDIFFPEHDFFEDMPTTPRLVSKSKKINFVEGQFYKYVVRQKSITNSYSAKHIVDYFKGFDLILSFLEENMLIDRYRDEFSEYVNRGMRFHSHSVLETGLSGEKLDQYLRHMLMFKIGYMEYGDVLRSKDQSEILELLQQNNILFLNQGIRFKEMLATKIAEKNVYIEELEVRRIELKNAVTAANEFEKFLLESRIRNKELTETISSSNKMLDESRARNKELSDIIASSKKLTEELSGKIIILEEGLFNVLNPFQGIGAWITGLFLSPFINKNQKNKLKYKPRSFFQDSKNSFTRGVGKFLKII